MPRASSLFRHDKKLTQKYPALVGIDEAGRGALAGPVVAAAVWADHSFFQSSRYRDSTVKMNDSKQLSKEKRETFFTHIQSLAQEQAIHYTHALEDVETIEKHNILGATKQAMASCVKVLKEKFNPELIFEDPMVASDALFENSAQSDPSSTLIIIDGKPLKDFPFHHKGIVAGDGTSLAIAMASIIAKVTRDHLMCNYHQQYPQYGFDNHKGYGTQEHCKAIHKYGPCPIHRPSFLKKLLNLPANQVQINFDIQ